MPQLPCLSSDTAEAGVPQCPRSLGDTVKPKKTHTEPSDSTLTLIKAKQEWKGTGSSSRTAVRCYSATG